MSNPPRVTFDRNGIIVTGDSIVYNREQLNIEKTDNTSDLNKPISTATQNALNLKAPLANPTFTGTVIGVTKGMVGLGNADNTSDQDKPISIPQKALFDLKADISYVDGKVSNLFLNSDSDLNSITELANALGNDNNYSTTILSDLSTKAPLANPIFTGNVYVDDKLIVVPGADVTGLTKDMVGLGNVDDTSDPNKPISTATQNALNLKADISYVNTEFSNLIGSAPETLDTLHELASALNNDNNYATTLTSQLSSKAPLANPTFTGTVTGVTKGMVGLGNVDNTSDLDKPTSTATQDALNLKASLTNPYFPLDLHVNNKLTVGGELVVGNIATFNNNVTYNGTVYADKIFIAGGGMKFDQSATANVLSQNMIDYITGLMGSS